MKSFLVIGEECTDIFVYGKAERLSPEAPVPVFVPTRSVENRGMAGNVIENLLSLHKQSTVLFEFTSNPKLLVKRRFVDEKSNHIFLRVDEDGDMENAKLYSDEHFLKMFFSADCIIISDYNKGFITDADYDWIFSNIPSSKIIIIDTKRILTKSILENADFIKLNEKEYKNNEMALGKELLSTFSEKLIITMGGSGTFSNGRFYPVEQKQTIDVSGAGDTFVASFAFMYSQTYDKAKSIIFANEMASIVVTKRGVSTVLN